VEANLGNNFIVEVALLVACMVCVRIAAIVGDAEVFASGLAGDVAQVLHIVRPRAIRELQAVALDGAEWFSGERSGDECKSDGEALHFDLGIGCRDEEVWKVDFRRLRLKIVQQQ
jgi:hypothetical protein